MRTPAKVVFAEIVIVALPADTPEADAEVLLSACDQAYPYGTCAEPNDTPPQVHVLAEVAWVSDTQAEVNVKYATSKSEQSAYRALEFRPNDERGERYRALGFTIGSMAGSVVSRVDEETRAEPEPPEGPQKETPVEVEPVPPPTVGPMLPPPLPERPRTDFEDDYRFGIGVGSGIDNTRWGVAIGARGVWHHRWVLDGLFSYAAQGSSTPDRIEASFFNFTAQAGVELSVGRLALTATGGPVVQLQFAERLLDESRTSASNERLGGELALGVRLRAAVAPFLETRVGWFDPTDIRLASDEVLVFEELQLQAILGLTLDGVELR